MVKGVEGEDSVGAVLKMNIYTDTNIPIFNVYCHIAEIIELELLNA